MYPWTWDVLGTRQHHRHLHCCPQCGWSIVRNSHKSNKLNRLMFCKLKPRDMGISFHINEPRKEESCPMALTAGSFTGRPRLRGRERYDHPHFDACTAPPKCYDLVRYRAPTPHTPHFLLSISRRFKSHVVSWKYTSPKCTHHLIPQGMKKLYGACGGVFNVREKKRKKKKTEREFLFNRLNLIFLGHCNSGNHCHWNKMWAWASVPTSE